ncbi:MAG TPA: hypothetical protein DCM28_17675 [Phycisphaerales bacterium]|nr:hypothetical protein [Phycisphaerales bacterium]HCD32746.1 hypothetical protein [Phycisphaerales bacterium]
MDSHLLRFMPLLCVLFVVTACVDAEVSPTWETYVKQKQQGVVTDTPDYSWAGYARGEKAIPVAVGKRFDVADFGAIPDDLLDDRDAIQKAIDAAAEKGGGVVTFHAGRYLVNTDMNDRGTIRIESSNIVLKGAGSREGGTIIHQIQPFGKGDPYDMRRMHLGDNVLLIHSRDEEKRLSTKPVFCKVTGDAGRETYSLTVDAVDQLAVGQRVYLYAMNRQVIDEAVKPFTIHEDWTTTTQNKAYIVEIHQIAALDGKKVTFAEPIRYDIFAKHNWELREHQPIENVGVEDIAFMGNHWHPYKHHRSGMDDSAWAMIKIKGVANSYVRRCSFINVSQSLYISLSSYVTAMNITQAGNTSHHSPRVSFYTYGVLAGLIDDQAASTHGPSLNAGTVGTVFWRWKGKDGSIDSHAGRPFTSLYDCVEATCIHSSGGRRSYPQHLRQLMLWNVKMDADKPLHYDFWMPEKNNVFVMPNIVGMHGSPVTFNMDHVGMVESNGKAVLPQSLYEAQLALRLGKLPAWVSDVQQEQKQLESQPLVKFYDRNDPNSPTWFYPETFNVNDMLGYLTKLSLKMFNTKLYTYRITDDKATLHTDQSFVRQTLYALMNAIYQHHNTGNTITAQPMSINGKPGIEFVITSGQLSKPVTDLQADELVVAAHAMANRIGGKIQLKQSDSQIQFVVRIPQLSAQ